MRCPRCNGRKYIELDKIGLRVCSCPECNGTGEISKALNPEKAISLLNRINQEQELLHDFEKVINDSNGGIDTDNRDIGEPNPSESSVTTKPKAKRKTRKKTR